MICKIIKYKFIKNDPLIKYDFAEVIFYNFTYSTQYIYNHAGYNLTYLMEFCGKYLFVAMFISYLFVDNEFELKVMN